jgi:Fic family protein
MERVTDLKKHLDALRPLTEEQIKKLWPMWDKEDALFVYASNAIEGSTLTLGETTVALEQGVTAVSPSATISTQ